MTAENLLRTTSHTLDEIAKIVGFNSQSHFSQTFKNRRGLTPSAYRRLTRQKLLSGGT